MTNQIFKPLFDKLTFIIWIPTSLLMLAVTMLAVLEPSMLWWLIPLDLFVAYFLISPAFGYVELREETLFVKFGFFMKREIPYKSIRGIVKEKRIYSESMLSLKNAIEHVNIKYGSFDVITVSVKDNDALIEAIKERKENIS